MIVTAESHPGRRRWLGTPSYWLAQSIGWGAIWLLQLAIAFGQERYKAALPITLFIVFAVLSTHLLRVYLIHLRSQSLPWRSLLPRVFGGLILTALVGTHVSALLSYYNSKDLNPGERFSYLSLFSILFTFGSWLSLYFGINYYRSYQQGVFDRLRLEAAVKDAELRLLRAQVDPHFLFNSLNTLRALIPADFATPQELATAREAVTMLSDVLRTSLLSDTRYTIPLSEELEHVENFLALEKLRFEARLQITQTVAPAALAGSVPTLLLQTLVENAIKYGITPREAGGVITLDIRIEATALVITVTNPGSLAVDRGAPGLGLKNARARLALIYGPAATLDLTEPSPDLVCVTVRYPITVLSALP